MKKILSLLLIVSLLLQNLLFFVSPVYAATSWNQTNWSSGVGASTTNQYSSGSNIDATTTAGQVTLGLNVGTGADGAITVSSTKTIDTDTVATGRTYADAVNFNISSSLAAGAMTINVGATPNGLVVGDEILIINLRGTSSDYSNVGKYETRYITSIATNTLTLDNALANTYDGTTQKIMVQRVPQYTNATVSSGGTLTVAAYNNTTGKGGVLFFKANGTVTVDSGGTISASGKGYEGGATSRAGGMTYNGAGGVGGASSTNGATGQGGGGGGGASGGTGAAGTVGGGGGGPGELSYAGGGGGGYGDVGSGGVRYGGAGGTAGAIGSGISGGAGGDASNPSIFYGGSGGGGGTYGLAALTQLYYGSGAGSGGCPSAFGGNGGGVVFIRSSTISVTGTINASGTTGGAGSCGQSAGGGGAGGSIFVSTNTATLGSSLITASGATGATAPAGYGHGGAGGVGRIAIYSPNAISGTTSPTYGTGVIGYSSSGTFTSNIFDTAQLSEWGSLSYSATTPTNTTATVKARTSNDSGMSGATAFASCTTITSGADISANSCITDGHRYIQYEVTLATSDTSATPIFSDVAINYTAFDTTAPVISLTALTPDPNSDSTPTLSGTAIDARSTVSAVQFQMDGTGGSWTACTANDGTFNSNSEAFTCTVTSALSDGSHTMYVRATDSLSNTTGSGSETSDTFTIDTVSSTISLTAISPDPGTDTTPTLTGTATDVTGTVATVQFQMDSTSGSWSSCTANDGSFNSASEAFTCAVTTALSDGSHTIYVRATDNASNISSNSSDAFSVDTTVPTQAELNSPDDKKYFNDDNINFKWKASTDATSGVKEYKLYLDDNLIKTTTDTQYEYDADEGKHTWYVIAVDDVNNEEQSDERTFYIDQTGPEIAKVSIDGKEISNDSAYSLNNLTPTLKIIADDPNKDDSESGVDKIEIEVIEKGFFADKVIETGTKTTDNGEISTTLKNLKTGKTYIVSLEAIDNLENTGDKYQFEIDIKLLAQKLDVVVNEIPTQVITPEIKQDEVIVETEKTTEIQDEVQEITPTVEEVTSQVEKQEPKKEGLLSRSGKMFANIYWWSIGGIKNAGNFLAQPFKKDDKEKVYVYVGDNPGFLYDAKVSVVNLFAFVFDKNPTQITKVKVKEIGDDYAIVSWQTNHYTYNNKVNYGESTQYGNEVFSIAKAKYHEAKLTNLEPQKEYFFEVMSQGKNYTYDAYYTFTTE